MPRGEEVSLNFNMQNTVSVIFLFCKKESITNVKKFRGKSLIVGVFVPKIGGSLKTFKHKNSQEDCLLLT